MTIIKLMLHMREGIDGTTITNPLSGGRTITSPPESICVKPSLGAAGIWRDLLKTSSWQHSVIKRRCYCLLDNQYHLHLETPEGNSSQIVQHIKFSCSTHYNVKHKNAGHLFQY